MSSYGVVGLANTSKFDNWRKNLIQSGHNQPGVSVTISEDDTIVVDLYIIIEYGTRISEVARGVSCIGCNIRLSKSLACL